VSAPWWWLLAAGLAAAMLLTPPLIELLERYLDAKDRDTS
jgi:hypothetical protein